MSETDEHDAFVDSWVRMKAAGITDEQCVQAIQGYREAGYYVSTDRDGNALEQGVYGWSEGAQKAIRDDVTRFLTDNADLAREFIARTNFPWLQVGIDFYLTRNGRESGFWDRGVGDTPGTLGDLLTEAARTFGTQFISLGPDDEMIVE